MIYRVYPQKDTWLTNTVKDATPQTGSNFGASEILELYKKTGISGTAGYAASSSIARTIIQFDLSEIASLTASGRAPSTGSAYFLKLFDAQHADTLPSSFDIEIAALSRSWDEGTGLDNDKFLDKGVANWDKATSAVLWTTPGGDFILSASATASYHFDTGHEDVLVDVTAMVGAWLTGGLPNYGFMVKITGSQENDGSDYYRKKFHAGNTKYLDKRPSIEMRWDDSIKDDRDNLEWNIQGDSSTKQNVYLYYRPKGQLTNIPGLATSGEVLDVTLKDPNGSFITRVSGSHTGLAGVYSASITFQTGSYTGSLFNDVWHKVSSGITYFTGSVTPHSPRIDSSNSQEQYVVKIKNLKKEYELNERVRFDMFVRTRSYNPAVVQTGSLKIGNTVITKGYYRIDNASTNEHVIPLGTGSLETTRLSYDDNGNYFNFYMNTLAKGEVYRIVFFFDVNGELKRVDDDFKFRVV